MSSPLHRLLLLLSLLPQLLFGVSRAVVVCVEPDGAVRLEFCSTACCEVEAERGSEVRGHVSRVEGASVAGDECAGCQDVTLVAVLSSRQVNPGGFLLAPLPAPLVMNRSAADLAGGCSASGPSADSPGLPPPHLDLQRSVLLRI